ncbi:MAG TPA: hypothetical protein K8W19_17460 [Victivallis vadensis]|nr:hypothetical protein [Victivallis vadensis]
MDTVLKAKNRKMTSKGRIERFPSACQRRQLHRASFMIRKIPTAKPTARHPNSSKALRKAGLCNQYIMQQKTVGSSQIVRQPSGTVFNAVIHEPVIRRVFGIAHKIAGRTASQRRTMIS